MKNVYILPTIPNDETAKGIWIKETRNWCNIYITSDEFLKKGKEDLGCYYLNFKGNISKKQNSDWQNTFLNDFKKKIILTTDTDLIADNVQPIDDNFLEWLVANPSCEEVGIKKENICARCYCNDVNDCWSAKECSDGKFDKIKYKIIILKETPNQELPGVGSQPFNLVLDVNWDSSQNHLEEAAEKLFKEYSNNTSLAEGHYEYMMDNDDFKEAFLEIFKWQQETMNNKYPIIIIRNDDKEEFIHLGNGNYKTKWGILNNSISTTPLKAFNKSKFTFYYE